MKLNSAQLEAFTSLAKILNFTKAAKSLYVTQSALSQRIAKLEEDLGVTLFIRDKSSIRLTEAGHRVLRFCQISDSAERDLLNYLKNSEGFGGILRVGSFSSVTRSLLLPSLKKIMQKNNNLSLQIVTKEIHELSDLLHRAEVDYILTTEKTESPDKENIFLGFEENVLVGLKKNSKIEIYLDHDEQDPTTKTFFSQNKMSFKPQQMRYLDDVYGLIDGVRNGFGKAILPRHLIEDEPEFEIFDSKKVLRIPVYLTFYQLPYYNQLHPLFLQEVQNYFKLHLSQKS